MTLHEQHAEKIKALRAKIASRGADWIPTSLMKTGVRRMRFKSAPITTSKPLNSDQWGPVLWQSLHKKALSPGGLSEEFLASFTQRVPCGQCRDEWKSLLKKIPPRFGVEGFAWTVEIHNAVNRNLGKPELDIASARSCHSS